MSLLSNILTGSVDKIVDSVSNGLDNLFTSDEERLVLKNELEKIRNQMKLEQMQLAQEQEKEITKRWVSDNENIITRLVRPISFMFVLILFGAIVLTDGNIGEFTINSAYIPVIETLLTTMVIAYFGSRGMEKVSKTIKENKWKKNTKV